jgi:hypothetical protein
MKKWFDKYSYGTQLLIVFMLNCIWWLFAGSIGYIIIEGESRSTNEVIFHMLWMGTFWTLIMHWKLVKSAFSKKKPSDDTAGEKSAY